MEKKKNQDNKRIKLRIEKLFLGFCLLDDHSTFGFIDTISKNITIINKKLPSQYYLLHGQSYDDAVVMIEVDM